MHKFETLILRVWLVISFFGLSWLFYKDLSRNSLLTSKTIDVERINVREADGTLRMVISNKKNQHSGVIDGHSAERERPAGMLFFNELGDEVGGLVYAGTNKENAGGSFTFDRWKNDQVIQLRYSEYKGEQYTGLIVSDRPNDDTLVKVIKIQQDIAKLDGEAKKAATAKLYDDVRSKKIDMGETRLFTGLKNGVAQIALYDGKGKLKIRISAGKEGVGKIEAFDEEGKVITK